MLVTLAVPLRSGRPVVRGALATLGTTLDGAKCIDDDVTVLLVDMPRS